MVCSEVTLKLFEFKLRINFANSEDEFVLFLDFSYFFCYIPTRAVCMKRNKQSGELAYGYIVYVMRVKKSFKSVILYIFEHLGVFDMDEVCNKGRPFSKVSFPHRKMYEKKRNTFIREVPTKCIFKHFYLRKFQSKKKITLGLETNPKEVGDDQFFIEMLKLTGFQNQMMQKFVI